MIFSIYGSKYYTSTLISNFVILHVLYIIGNVPVPNAVVVVPEFGNWLAASLYPLVNIAYGDNLNSRINS